ncbi:hypothetical protein B7C42_06297 [Nocardia cerradoensis]|uniref:Uncharacterized protein n=1 Tax=Nocardia cerradoensis TaxID=85688 RepID=A0A231GYH5_9NOCA|nr:hypothetical protein B7C42_06297 [Nocardia cerradoensis]
MAGPFSGHTHRDRVSARPPVRAVRCRRVSERLPWSAMGIRSLLPSRRRWFDVGDHTKPAACGSSGLRSTQVLSEPWTRVRAGTALRAIGELRSRCPQRSPDEAGVPMSTRRTGQSPLRPGVNPVRRRPAADCSSDHFRSRSRLSRSRVARSIRVAGPSIADCRLPIADCRRAADEWRTTGGGLRGPAGRTVRRLPASRGLIAYRAAQLSTIIGSPDPIRRDSGLVHRDTGITPTRRRGARQRTNR